MQAVLWTLWMKLTARINLNHSRLRQKISLSIMTSHNHICVQFVTNSLREKIIWKNINRSILKKACIRAVHVRKVFHHGTYWDVTRICTLINTSAQNVANVVQVKCTECGKRCASSRDLAAHKRVHSGDKPFECRVCSKRFTRAGSLIVHSRIHSGEKTYKCQVCDMLFSASGRLSRHMRVHTGEKPYECSQCSKSFSQFSNLQSHKRHAHSNRRPYHCPYCGKTFKTNSDLKRHVRTHTDAKPYLLNSHNEGAYLIWYYISFM